jgi:Cytochrome P460
MSFESPSLELPRPIQPETSDSNDVSMKEVLTQPGTRLIMPSEESDIKRGEETKPRSFEVFRRIGSSSKKSPHKVNFETFGRVFANKIAQTETENPLPKFDVGSVLVREMFLNETDSTPNAITAMVKRQKGFNKKTGDWEYFTFNGADMKLQKRESVSSCSKCHANAAKTDYVFRDFLK